MAVYIGLAYFIVLYAGYSIYQRVKQPELRHFVPLLECDFETGAVWGRGGGQIVKDEEEEEKRVGKADLGVWRYHWSKFKENVY